MLFPLPGGWPRLFRGHLPGVEDDAEGDQQQRVHRARQQHPRQKINLPGILGEISIYVEKAGTGSCNNNILVFEEILSRTALTWHIGKKTEF